MQTRDNIDVVLYCIGFMCLQIILKTNVSIIEAVCTVIVKNETRMSWKSSEICDRFALYVLMCKVYYTFSRGWFYLTNVYVC